MGMCDSVAHACVIPLVLWSFEVCDLKGQTRTYVNS